MGKSGFVDEFCRNLAEKRDCVCDGQIDGIIMGMYLNILEYIADEKKREELMEMIGVSEKVEGVLAQIRQEAKRDIINMMLENHSVEEISRFSGMKIQEILNILAKID